MSSLYKHYTIPKGQENGTSLKRNQGHHISQCYPNYERNLCFYFIDTRVLKNQARIKFVLKKLYILHLSGIFSISSLFSSDIHLINSAFHGCLLMLKKNDINYSLRFFVKYNFYHS